MRSELLAATAITTISLKFFQTEVNLTLNSMCQESGVCYYLSKSCHECLENCMSIDGRYGNK